MILSFSVFKEKIESGDKCQTIRKYSEGQYKRFLNCWNKRETTGRYNLFWHNPRNGGTRIKDVIPTDKPIIIKFDKNNSWIYVKEPSGIWLPMSWEYIKQTIFDDGFILKSEMFDWFFKEYGEKMFTEEFMVIRW